MMSSELQKIVTNFDPTGFVQINTTDYAKFYKSPAEKYIIKVYINDAELNQIIQSEYDHEVKDLTFIKQSVTQSPPLLGNGLYIEMLTTSPTQRLIVYPFYQQTLQTLIESSTAEDVDLIREILCRTLMSYIIFHQKTSRIHGQFIYKNIVLNSNYEPIISGFGHMVEIPNKNKCKIEHIAEFVWFIIQLRDYVTDILHDKVHPRPWLKQLIQPKIIADLCELDYTGIKKGIAKITKSDLDLIYQQWIV
jgi:hypothetical protein